MQVFASFVMIKRVASFFRRHSECELAHSNQLSEAAAAATEDSPSQQPRFDSPFSPARHPHLIQQQDQQEQQSHHHHHLHPTTQINNNKKKIPGGGGGLNGSTKKRIQNQSNGIRSNLLELKRRNSAENISNK